MPRMCGFFMFFATVLAVTLLSHVGAANLPGQYSYEIPDDAVLFNRAQRAGEDLTDEQMKQIISLYLSHLMKPPSQKKDPFWLRELKNYFFPLDERFRHGNTMVKYVLAKAISESPYGPGRKR